MTKRSGGAPASSVKAGHTPGPWRYDMPLGQPVKTRTWRVRSADGGEVAAVPRNNDARLIAAAPTMYEALRAILTDADRALAGDGNDAEHDALFDTAVAAYAAIKLVEGEK